MTLILALPIMVTIRRNHTHPYYERPTDWWAIWQYMFTIEIFIALDIKILLLGIFYNEAI